MRFFRLVALSVFGALILASCGATTVTVETSTDAETVSDEIEFVASRAFLLSSIDRVQAAQSYQFEGFVELESIMSMGSRTEPIMTGTVVGDRASLDTNLGPMLGDLGAFGSNPFGDLDEGDLRMSTVVDGEDLFLNAPFYGATLGEIPPGLMGDVDLSWVDTVSNGWGQIRLGELVEIDDVQSQALAGGMSAEQILELLRSVSTVTEAGPSQVRGVDTNVLTATVSFGDLLEASGGLDGLPESPHDEADLSELMDTPINFEVHVDNNGLLRRTVFSSDLGAVSGLPAEMWQQFDFFNYGADLSVEIPAGAQDITDAFASLLELTGG